MGWRRRAWGVGLAWALAACQGPPPVAAGGKGRPSPGPRSPATLPPAKSGASPDPLAGPLPSPLPPPPLALPSPAWGPAPVPQGALVGQVQAPEAWLQAAGIVSNHGGGIVSNHGGGILSNHGSGFRLAQALAEAYASGAIVELLDAQGQALLDAEGRPWRATTNAEGRFAFPVAPVEPARLRLRLSEAHGDVEALALPGVPEGRLNLVSSLVTTYVLGQYVLGQPDPKRTLGRLTPEVEAETRAKAAAALAAAGSVQSLQGAEVLRAVGAMRQADPGFDAQLEAVKRLLIPAGQLSFGSGQPAKEVPLPRLGPLVSGPGATVCMAVGQDALGDYQQVWRLEEDGTMRLLVGGAAGAYGSLRGLTSDPQGRLYVGREAAYGMELPMAQRGTRHQVHRVESDGALTLMWEGEGELQGLGWSPAHGLLALSQRRGFDAATQRFPLRSKHLHAGLGPAAPKELAQWAPEALRAYSWGSLNLSMAVDAGGALWVMGHNDQALFGYPLLLKLPLGAGAIEEFSPPEGMNWFALSPDGQAYAVDSGKVVHAWRPGGALSPTSGWTGVGADFLDLGRVLRHGADEAWYLWPKQGVMRWRASDGAQHVAGRPDASATDASGRVILQAPSDLVVGPDDALWLLDGALLKRVRPGASVELLGGPAPTLSPGASQLGLDRLVGVGAGGDLLALGKAELGQGPTLGHSHFLGRSSAGAWRVLALPPAGQWWEAAARRPGGGVLLAHGEGPFGGAGGGLVYWDEDRQATEAVGLQGRALAFQGGMAWEPRLGAFVVRAYVNQSGYQWWRWRPGEALAELPSTPAWHQEGIGRLFGPLGDAQGRLLWPASLTAIHRDAGPGSPGQALIGSGGRLFSGSGVDDGLRSLLAWAWGPAGDLYLLDAGAKQVKRIPPADLGP